MNQHRSGSRPETRRREAERTSSERRHSNGVEVGTARNTGAVHCPRFGLWMQVGPTQGPIELVSPSGPHAQFHFAIGVDGCLPETQGTEDVAGSL